MIRPFGCGKVDLMAPSQGFRLSMVLKLGLSRKGSDFLAGSPSSGREWKLIPWKTKKRETLK